MLGEEIVAVYCKDNRQTQLRLAVVIDKGRLSSIFI